MFSKFIFIFSIFVLFIMISDISLLFSLFASSSFSFLWCDKQFCWFKSQLLNSFKISFSLLKKRKLNVSCFKKRWKRLSNSNKLRAMFKLLKNFKLIFQIFLWILMFYRHLYDYKLTWNKWLNFAYLKTFIHFEFFQMFDVERKTIFLQK